MRLWRSEATPVDSRRLLAMQKVDGSSPFIRLREALETGAFCWLVGRRGSHLQPQLQPDWSSGSSIRWV